ncbi:hypothetical protein KPH14_007485 [Odynerus spinipes]|uniref:Uncharacterized protein n=1 Tax=Odynerus spinipes TaxID=1348599 RepID=A0AAD9RB70_9HYME|nr:hypothetical protein KPH14_007485 [Odynerus spinipes]
MKTEEKAMEMSRFGNKKRRRRLARASGESNLNSVLFDNRFSRRESLKASAVLMTSTKACSSNFRMVVFLLWLTKANLKADWTSSVPCSKIAPVTNEYKAKFSKWIGKSLI